MGKKHYSVKEDQQNTCRAQGSSWRVHFKNTTETANAIRGMTVKRAMAYLKNVIARKECVPFKKFNGSVGRCAQAKQFKTTQGRWPRKSADFLIDLLKCAVSNAEYMGLDTEHMYIKHIQTNPGPVSTRRTHRAHGRITPYNRHLTHIQVILAEPETP